MHLSFPGKSDKMQRDVGAETLQLHYVVSCAAIHL